MRAPSGAIGQGFRQYLPPFRYGERSITGKGGSCQGLVDIHDAFAAGNRMQNFCAKKSAALK